jgi:ABC-type multidrug transport system fused ATPase/permease subunit
MLSIVSLLLLLADTDVRAQEIEQSIAYAEKYLNSRTADLGKYLRRSGKIRQRLLRRLQRKEDEIARKLAAKDSTLYRQYMQQRLSYDSIARLQQDTASLRQRFSARKNALADSLKNIQSFISKQSSKLNSAAGLPGKAGADIPYTGELNKLQQQLNAQQGIDELIKQRTSSLEGLAGKADISGLQNIQKQVYYAQEKIKAWKKLADDPDEAEEEALEYLQGTPGFSEAFSSNSEAFGGLGDNATAEDLQKLGYQTKQSVNKMLTDKLGNSLGNVQEQMSKQVQQYTDKLDDVTGKIQEARQGINEAKQTLNEARQAKDKLKHLEKPAFKKNPERAKPFWQRLETSCNFQTTRATPDGLRPAILELAASVAFKHSPRLSYGAGIGLSTGLGQNWQNIRFTYEGISARAFADWKALYGFSLQAGYERSFRPQNRAYLPSNAGSNDPSNPASDKNIFKEMFGGQQQAAYIGIMKRYRLNSKYNGTIMAGYNFLWQQEELRSPWILRFGWSR